MQTSYTRSVIVGMPSPIFGVAIASFAFCNQMCRLRDGSDSRHKFGFRKQRTMGMQPKKARLCAAHQTKRKPKITKHKHALHRPNANWLEKQHYNNIGITA